jgi:hypothetical protein
MLKRISVVVAMMLLVSGRSFADDSDSLNSAVHPVQLLSFQVGGISAFQGSGYSGGGVVRYLPSYQLAPNWKVGLSVDAALLKLDTNSDFAAVGYMAFVRRKILDSWDLQLSAGAQTWTYSGAGTSLVIGPTVSYDLAIQKAPWFKNVWIAYLPVFQSTVAQEIQFGAGLQF